MRGFPKILGWAVPLALVGHLAMGDPQGAATGLAFREIPPEESGLTWRHDNAMSPERYLPETVGAGCAFLDFDGDGWMDLFLVNSGRSDFHKPRVPLRNALYRNHQDGTFRDVTAQAGVAGGAFGMGAAVGDYDDDGRPDLYVTAYGRATLYRNQGDGTFADVTEKAGVGARGWTTSAVFFDYDQDGRLDLFVASYVRYGTDVPSSCGPNPHGQRYYCVPRMFKPTPSLLFHNNGDGTFTDVSAGAGLARSPGKALGVVAVDVNRDGLTDLFVSNDTSPNFLFLNRGEGRFEETGTTAHVAFSASGEPRSGMGVDAADYDADGWSDLLVANIDQELFSLYRNARDGSFVDEAGQNGIAAATQVMSGWGLKLFDADNDGWPDLLLANGHPDDTVDSAGGRVRYKEPLLVFRNQNGRFLNVSAEAGPAFRKDLTARGMAVGDFDNDGRVDALVCQNGGAPVLLRNESGGGNHWLGLRLLGTRSGKDAVGAVVRWSAGGKARERQKTGGGSYLSSHDPRLVLGLGRATSADWVEVKWPGAAGRVERFDGLGIDHYVTLVEGAGEPAR